MADHGGTSRIENIQVLFEDDAVVAIDKPPGVVVNRAESVQGETVQDWAERQPWYGKWSSTDQDGVRLYTQRSGIAHRLDKDTSGVMLLAKTPEALLELLRQFREREVLKQYLALTHGKFSAERGTIRLPLARSGSDRERFAIDPDGKMSETAYEVVQFYPDPPRTIPPKLAKKYQGFSLVRLEPKTGRTHQIRVHMSAMNHPLVGDARYLGRARAQLDLQWCPRQFLHAEKILFTSPMNMKRVQVLSNIPKDLSAVFELL